MRSPFMRRPREKLADLAPERRLRHQFGLLQQRAQIEWCGEHRKPAVRTARPLLTWPIPIKLDPVVIGIAQIERFAHAVIGSALERNIGRDQTSKRISQCGGGRIQHGQMVEARGTRRWWIAAAAFPRIEPDVMVIAAGGNKCCLRSPALHQLEAERAAIEVQRAINIGDLEMDMANANAGVNGSYTHSARLCGESAGKRRHAQCRDAVSRPTQHLKREAMERETVSRFRD